jgi:integrase
VSGVGDPDDAHVGTRLEHVSLVVADSDVVALAVHDPRRHARIGKTRGERAVAVEVLEIQIRRVYDLRHTFATFALRAGISTFDLSRYMGASLTMIDRHYGHLARDGRDHAINLLDAYSRPGEADVHQVDVAWTLQQRAVATSANRRRL